MNRMDVKYLRELRIGMPERIHGDACAEVKVLPPLGVPNVCTAPAREHKRRPRVHGEEELCRVVDCGLYSG